MNRDKREFIITNLHVYGIRIQSSLIETFSQGCCFEQDVALALRESSTGTGDDSRSARATSCSKQHPCENVSINEDCIRIPYTWRLVMMNSRLSRFMGVVVGAIAVGFASGAKAASSYDQKLHVAAAPADFAALGIG